MEEATVTSKKMEVKVENKFTLPNIKVKVVPIRREGAWLPKDHSASFLFGESSIKYQVPLIGKDRLATVLSKEEREVLEPIIARDLNPALPMKTNFWAKRAVKLLDETRILDLSDAHDYIDYKILQLQKNAIAPSYSERFLKGTYKFALADIQFEENSKAKKASAKSNAYKLFAKLTESKQKAADFLSLFFQSKPGKRVPEDASAAWLEGEISDLIENNLNEFLTVAEDKEYHNKVFIYNAVAKKAIIRREGRYLTPEGELIASNIDDMILWIKDTMNNEEVFKIEARIATV